MYPDIDQVASGDTHDAERDDEIDQSLLINALSLLMNAPSLPIDVGLRRSCRPEVPARCRATSISTAARLTGCAALIRSM